MRLFKTLQNEQEEDDDLPLRAAVKASHASTGFGSIYAFLVGSQMYSRFGSSGAGYLGLGMATAKYLTIIQIDLLHARKKKRMEQKEAKEADEITDVESAP